MSTRFDTRLLNDRSSSGAAAVKWPKQGVMTRPYSAQLQSAAAHFNRSIIYVTDENIENAVCGPFHTFRRYFMASVSAALCWSSVIRMYTDITTLMVIPCSFTVATSHVHLNYPSIEDAIRKNCFLIFFILERLKDHRYNYGSAYYRSDLEKKEEKTEAGLQI